MPGDFRLKDAVAAFRVGGELQSIRPFGSGHINDTWLSRVDTASGPCRFVHQRINAAVFRSPGEVMENIQRVTTHIRDKLALRGVDPERRVLSLVPAVGGGCLWRDPEGGTWRTYRYIEGATAHDVANSRRHARNVAAAFGLFQQQVGDLPGPTLHETIPGFADTHRRFEDFLRAVDADRAGRARECVAEIDFARHRERLASRFDEWRAAGRIPERIVHLDTKINNVLIDDATDEALCVIDLDTVMPGTALYDFGDLVRSGAACGPEDDPNAAAAGLDLGLFDAMVEGYLGATRAFLTRHEVDHLADAAGIVTLTIGVRFLTDFLDGDAYFKTTRPAHNLDRCRTQFAMVRSIEDNADRLHAIIDRWR